MCDTLVLNKRLTENRQHILAKNSDRPLGECQPLGLFPAGTRRDLPPFVKAEDLKLFDGTGISKEGSRYAVLGSRPYWLYGFEMGANEQGLCIGNEAEGSRCPAESSDGILGMDMLRYALESCESCREAIGKISLLLEKYGQSANASLLFDRRYENTYILADPLEVWVMETAGRLWAAKKISWMEAVSNCYTIGTDYNLCADGMEAYVRENRLVHPEDPVDFAKAFTKPGTRQRLSVPRRNRMIKLCFEMLSACLNEKETAEFMEQLSAEGADDERKILVALQKRGARIRFEELSYIFRDHFEEEIIEFRFGPLGGENVSVCMHANTWDEAQTAASLITTYDHEVGIRFLWAPASPCSSLYLPVWWVETLEGATAGPRIPAIMSAGGEFYDPASLWWVMERLVTLTSVCEERYYEDVILQLGAIEDRLRTEIPEAEKKAAEMIRKGNPEDAQAFLDKVTEKYAGELSVTAACLADSIAEDIAAAGGLYGPRKEFVAEYAAKTKMPL